MVSSISIPAGSLRRSLKEQLLKRENTWQPQTETGKQGVIKHGKACLFGHDGVNYFPINLGPTLAEAGIRLFF
ncbi:MAG: hypothetical protein HY525_15860 [Betaproteobacteria bacterium]|nr:hypothetical protein [Betaproteobacteria bacterium]